MSDNNNFVRVGDALPKENMFVDAILLSRDGSFKTMKVFYRAKVKKEYFKDSNGIRREKVNKVGFVIQKPHKDMKVVAWRKHMDVDSIIEELNSKKKVRGKR